MAGIKNFKVDQSTNFTFTIIYKDPDGDPIDLTQYRVFMDIKSAPGSKKVLASLTQGNGITVTPLQGKIEVNATPDNLNEGFFVSGSINSARPLDVLLDENATDYLVTETDDRLITNLIPIY